ncbi:GrpB family protein [Hymenobacter metallicola]|uniref:GrpB family protein n=1 Tax=Hymenobacter metallicola TaxID=2563114 RepID=A0A4Z0QHH8_9BACT|nr:GrpB family protein [Hymenobacter metallicola]TGE29224.1 GrpB family protein [Hymenobacter metallicola]
MPNVHPFDTRKPVVLVPYRPEWAPEFAALARRLRALAGPAVLRIDHIGSTAVPGLRAKDVLDLQLTVPDLLAVADLVPALQQAGFRQGESLLYDVFHFLPAASAELRKRYMREPAGERTAHLHIREAGRFNARYALLFRDYLRASPVARTEYELLKVRAAELFPDNIAGYLYLKEPVFHLLYEAACLWAEKVGWQLPAPDA